ncbi:MAG: MotA/TolQ/ExbB proton channel family protein [Pseudomonadota bacterium]
MSDAAETGPEGTAQAPADLAAADLSEAAAPAASALDRLSDLGASGGTVLALLALMSVFALALALAKTLQFARAGLGDAASVDAALALWARGEDRAAAARARAGRGPACALADRAMQDALAGLPEGARRESARRAAMQASDALRAWLRPLEMIAALAPLLGLFGTVLGMIDAFAALERAGRSVDPSLLSGGIWEALLTTAAGLAVAMPAVALHGWLDRRAEREEMAMEAAVAGVFARPAPPAPAPQEEAANDAAPPHPHAAE